MSAVCWSHLLPDPSSMGRLSTDDLDAIERTAECEAMAVAHGIAARNIGWLINSLGTLSGRLADVANGAEYELSRRGRSQ